jgi:hypothetical protein
MKRERFVFVSPMYMWNQAHSKHGLKVALDPAPLRAQTSTVVYLLLPSPFTPHSTRVVIPERCYMQQQYPPADRLSHRISHGQHRASRGDGQCFHAQSRMEYSLHAPSVRGWMESAFSIRGCGRSGCWIVFAWREDIYMRKTIVQVDESSLTHANEMSHCR